MAQKKGEERWAIMRAAGSRRIEGRAMRNRRRRIIIKKVGITR